MLFFDEFENPPKQIHTQKYKKYDDNIYTFDIETISLFKINDEWKPFDYSIKAKEYQNIEKACCPYIWQFSVNDTVYYGREFMDFEKVLKKLADDEITKYIYVHNLSYEMQFLLDIIDKNNWTIEDVCARNLRQPIQFKIKELNIYFRCSYMLTNLSLEKSAEKYTDIKKLVGYLDYNVPYSPLSSLPEKALEYAEFDCKVLYKIILYFKNEYGHIKDIPLTQTGEVRRALRKEVGYYYIKKMQKLVPPEKIYCALMASFQGGMTHANILYANRIIKDVWSYDFCSSYPYVLTCFKMPSEAFRPIRESDILRLKDNYCILYDVTLKNVRATKHNHYLSYSKMTDVTFDDEYTRVIDNGRLVKCKSCRIICTDYDMECIKNSYDCIIEYNHIWASFARFLDKKVIRFILQRYSDKTTLKGVKGQEDYYMKMKQQANCCFGMASTNPLRTGIEFNFENGWFGHDLNDIVDDGQGNEIRFIDKKLNDMKKSYSTLFFYAVGVWVCAIARYNLWRNIIALDDYVCYYDTDSIKGVGSGVEKVVEDYNKEVIERLKESSKINDIPLEMYMPKDIKGIVHPLGVFECETEDGKYQEFKTLGAKKYCYRTCDGELHMTVSGVRKKAVCGLNDDINNFKDGFMFSYEDTMKLIHYYYDNQESFTYIDVDGNKYSCVQKHSIILQPTTYTIGLTDIYEALIDNYMGQLTIDI